MTRALFGIAAVSVWAGCFYTDGINEAPSAVIRNLNPTEPLFAESTLTLSANDSSDPDGDELTFSWIARSCEPMVEACPAAPQIASLTSTSPEFALEVPDKNPVYVQLLVTDSHGAPATAEDSFFVGDRAPAVSVQVQGVSSPAGGYTVGRPLVVIASATDEDELDPVNDLELTWTPFPVAGSDPKTREWMQLTGDQCPPASSPEVKRECYHLRPDVDGLWRVRVVVTDGVETEGLTESILVEPDMPPCVATTTPQLVPGALYILERTEDVRRFAALSVTDELDPYPLPPNNNDPDRGEATFRWWLASPDTSGVRVEIDHTLADYYLDPSLYAPGDRLELRVEVSDRVARALPCADEAPTCSIGDDGCLQRVSWAVEIR